MGAPAGSINGGLRAASLGQMVTWVALLLGASRLWPDGQGGVFWGGALMAANLSAMRLAAAALLPRPGLPGLGAARRSRAAALVLAGKFVGMLAATAAVVHYAEPHPLGLFAGFATLLAGVLAAAAMGITAKERGSAWTTTPPG